MAAPASADRHFRTTRAYMDTPVTIAIVAPADDPDCAAVADRAFAWFAEVEACCSRFDPTSELRRLAAREPATPVAATRILFEAVRFACAVAERSGGAFDPAIGARQQARGLLRNYRTGRAEPWRAPECNVPHPEPPAARLAPSGAGTAGTADARAAAGTPAAADARATAGTSAAADARATADTPAAAGTPGRSADPTWRDIEIDPATRTIALRRPLLLDLGAVAKGMAIDLAARQIATTHRDFLVEAGGDLFAGGCGADGRPWRVGIRHPRVPDGFSAVLAVTDAAVCTSGDCVRRTADGGHHILDPRTVRSAAGAIACSVLAPSAMLADALATAAFVLGPGAGVRWLAREGVQGLIVAADLRLHATAGWAAHTIAAPPAAAAAAGRRRAGARAAPAPGRTVGPEGPGA